MTARLTDERRATLIADLLAHGKLALGERDAVAALVESLLERRCARRTPVTAKAAPLLRAGRGYAMNAEPRTRIWSEPLTDNERELINTAFTRFQSRISVARRWGNFLLQVYDARTAALEGENAKLREALDTAHYRLQTIFEAKDPEATTQEAWLGMFEIDRFREALAGGQADTPEGEPA